MSTLNINEKSFITKRSYNTIPDPIDKAIDKYKLYSSMVLIQKHLENHNIVSFKTVEIGDTEKEINNIILRRQQLIKTFLQKSYKKSSRASAVFYISYLTIQ